MALANIDIPFNKDQASIKMGKEAISSLEDIFEMIQEANAEDNEVEKEELMQQALWRAELAYKHFQKTFPKK